MKIRLLLHLIEVTAMPVLMQAEFDTVENTNLSFEEANSKTFALILLYLLEFARLRLSKHMSSIAFSEVSWLTSKHGLLKVNIKEQE